MKRAIILKWIVLAAGLISLNISCAVPRALWPQKDLSYEKTAASTAEHKVLLASRDSAFKREVVEKVNANLTADGTAVQVIGIDALESAEASRYDAVVLLNSCIFEGFDSEVQNFLDSHDQHEKVIVVTTSGKGDWEPKDKNRAYDAISSASKLTSADAVAREVTERVRSRFGTR